MNRRQSLKALTMGSVGAAIPFKGWSAGDHADGVACNNIDDPSNDTGGSSVAAPPDHPADYKTIHLVADKQFLDTMSDSLPAGAKASSAESGSLTTIVAGLGAGEAMIWIGTPENIPKELSVGGFRISAAKVPVSICTGGPLALPALKFRDAMAFSAFISPPKEMPHHNIDEEVRADFLPVLESKDRFGKVIGYPGIVMNYYAPSLAGKRFKGCECFFFLFDQPLEALGTKEWTSVLASIAMRRESGLQVTEFTTDFASYKEGERIQIRSRLYNRRPGAVSAVLQYSYKPPGGTAFIPLASHRRVPESSSETEAICTFRPGYKAGLWTIRMDVAQDVAHAALLAFEGSPSLIDRREIGFMMTPPELSTASILEIKGPSIIIDNEEGFHAGTHYYPSTSWWEWVWKDFRPLKAAEDLAAIRRCGYRIVRVWIDPVIDEIVLRAMDAAIQLASDNGIVLDICVFTQWTRQMGFETPDGKHTRFDYREKRDFNVVSFSLRNLDLQRSFLHIIGSRWKEAGNIFFDLANEVYLKDPDATQMDIEAQQWDNIPKNNSVLRDSLLFRRWGLEMTRALRSAGARQPVMPGYMFSTAGGGDVYVANKDAPLVPWHSYAPTEQTGITLHYFDPMSSGRAVLLEELGVLGWNNENNYDGTAHYALASGAAGAMSYEWGISWLSRESCFWPLPLRDTLVDDPDPRWFPAYLDICKTWSEKGVGLCPTPSGTGYGSIYHGTPFPAAAAVALGRLGIMGKGLQRVAKPEAVYVIVPATNPDAIKPIGEFMKMLWSEKVIAGIWQEEDIAALPSAAKAVICPVRLSSASAAAMQNLQTKGIKIYYGPHEWKSFPGLERVQVTPGDKTDVMIRATAGGHLFTVISKGYTGDAILKYRSQTLKLSVSNFAMAHVTGDGIVLIEGEGNLIINNKSFCKADRGRVIVSAEDGNALTDAKLIRLMVSQPTSLSFRKNIASVSLTDGFGGKPAPAGTEGISGTHLFVDDQLMKYVIWVAFK